jgi:hypothetical protein
MAFGGSLGKFFGISTPEAAQIASSFATGGIGPGLATTIGSLGTGSDVPAQNVLTTFPTNQGGQVPMETSPSTPAGLDSPATLSPVSQTSMAPQQAFIGGFGLPGLATGLIGQAAKTLARPGVGGLIGGLGAGAAVDFFIDQFGQQKKLVITRKMQRDVKKLFMMSGGDFNMTAELYRMATGRSITGEQVVKIITKTFKNQGPYVTKAAVRKTRSTIRKMETLCDLKDRLCPPKPARRRPAARRSTMITQVK